MRPLGQLSSITLAAERRLDSPFFSPNSQSVGFYDRSGRTRLLKRVAIRGGPPSTICETQEGLKGASWGADGTIIFATGHNESGLWRVAAAGGEPEQLTTPPPRQGVVDHFWPEILPGGEAVLFTITADPIEDSQIAVLSLDTREQKVVIRGGFYPRYSPTGHLLYGLEGTLWAVRFDLSRLEAVGDPVPVQEGVLTKIRGTADFSLSDNGTLVYLQGSVTPAVESTLVFVNRQGTIDDVPVPSYDYVLPRFSPDGTRIAVQINAGDDSNIFIYELSNNRLRQLTFDGGESPIWMPDGSQITFLANGALWNIASDFSEERQLLSESSEDV